MKDLVHLDLYNESLKALYANGDFEIVRDSFEKTLDIIDYTGYEQGLKSELDFVNFILSKFEKNLNSRIKEVITIERDLQLANRLFEIETELKELRDLITN